MTDAQDVLLTVESALEEVLSQAKDLRTKAGAHGQAAASLAASESRLVALAGQLEELGRKTHDACQAVMGLGMPEVIKHLEGFRRDLAEATQEIASQAAQSSSQQLARHDALDVAVQSQLSTIGVTVSAIGPQLESAARSANAKLEQQLVVVVGNLDKSLSSSVSQLQARTEGMLKTVRADIAATQAASEERLAKRLDGLVAPVLEAQRANRKLLLVALTSAIVSALVAGIALVVLLARTGG